MGFFSDFKAFASKGNVLDMAIGVIIGGAFGKIVTSLVNNIIMPSVGTLIGGINFKDLKYVITPETVDAAGKKVAEVSIGYGLFLQNTIDFLIIAFSIFCFVTLMKKSVLRRKKKEEETPAPEPEPTKEELLLTEIRDLMKEKK